MRQWGGGGWPLLFLVVVALAAEFWIPVDGQLRSGVTQNNQISDRAAGEAVAVTVHTAALVKGSLRMDLKPRATTRRR